MQPITQLFTKIKPANEIARADLDATRANAKQTENEIALKVHQLYYSVLIAQLHQSASEARIKATEALKSERVQQVKYGSALDQELIESTAQYLQAKQELLTTELLLSNLTMQLNDVVGLPLVTRLELEAVPSEEMESCKQEECVKIALESHPEVVAARRRAAEGFGWREIEQGGLHSGPFGLRSLHLLGSGSVPCAKLWLVRS